MQSDAVDVSQQEEHDDEYEYYDEEYYEQPASPDPDHQNEINMESGTNSEQQQQPPLRVDTAMTQEATSGLPESISSPVHRRPKYSAPNPHRPNTPIAESTSGLPQPVRSPPEPRTPPML